MDEQTDTITDRQTDKKVRKWRYLVGSRQLIYIRLYLLSENHTFCEMNTHFCLLSNLNDIQNSYFVLQIFAIYIDLRSFFHIYKMFHFTFFKGTSSDRPRPCKDVWRRGWVSKHNFFKNSADLNPDQYNKYLR